MIRTLKSILLVVFTITLVQAVFGQRSFIGKVVEVIDGKTVVIEVQSRNKITVELQYIEVPEPEQELHQTVKDHLQNLLLNKIVEVRPAGMTKLKTIGQIYWGSVDIAQQMIRDGAAWYNTAENSTQSPEDKEFYEINETQARFEKRGIWGIKDLKPAWEFRAEKEKLKRSDEQVKRETKEAVSPKPHVSKTFGTPRWSREEQQEANANIEMWANAGEAALKQMPGFTGLYEEYEPFYQLGLVATKGTKFDLTQSTNIHQVECRVGFLYQGERSKIQESTYLIGFLSESPSWNFLTSNQLMIFADKQKYDLGRAYRFSRRAGSVVQEFLVYKIPQTTLKKISKAEKFDIKLGGYAGSAGNETIILIETLLKASTG